jgi:hypothetical protein
MFFVEELGIILVHTLHNLAESFIVHLKAASKGFRAMCSAALEIIISKHPRSDHVVAVYVISLPFN